MPAVNLAHSFVLITENISTPSQTTRAATDEAIDWMSFYNHRRLAFDVGLRRSDAVRAALARRSGKAGRMADSAMGCGKQVQGQN